MFTISEYTRIPLNDVAECVSAPDFTQQGGFMNIFETIEAHHDVLRNLFEKALSDPANFDELNKNLRVHHENEEQILLQALARQEKLRDEALESIEEHRIIEWMLIDLKDFPREDERWRIKLEILQEFTEHHLEEEEEDLFKDGRKLLPGDRTEEMGNLFDLRKNQQLEVL